MDLTVTTDAAARAAARADRLLPSRAVTAGAGIHLSAGGSLLQLFASDGEVTVRAELTAAVAVDGGVAVSRRALATTLASVTAPEVRLRREGARLAIRTPSARYAIPILEPAAPAVTAPDVPAVAGCVEAAQLRAAGLAVAGAASRDGLPIFTGVRVRGVRDGHDDGPGISLVATDRFRMASATVPWLSGGSGAVDVLVAAGVLAEAARQLPATGPVLLRCAADRFGVDWAGGGIVAASLALPFPDEQIAALLRVSPMCSVQVEADALAAAVQRAVPFAGASGQVHLEALDGVVVIRGADAGSGESREEVKADVAGDHFVAAYQGRYLADAVRPFAGRVISVQIQEGIRPTLFAAAELDPIRLRCLVVPLRKR